MIEYKVSKEDKMIMKLIHYFVTKENYKPVVVRGVDNEIWLENLDNEIPLIRINTNYIHNNEQLEIDQRKVTVIRKTIKKKTFSINMNVLNLLVNAREEVNVIEDRNIFSIKCNSITELKKNKFMTEYFPNFKDGVLNKNAGYGDMFEMTEELNRKTLENDKDLSKVFLRHDTPYITYILIFINVVMFLLSILDYTKIIDLFANYYVNVKKGEIYRLITYSFVHANFLHLFFNMYALYYIGPQVEKYYGKMNYLIIYLGSALMGGLFTTVLTSSVSVGASSSIFGLFSSMLYFGYKYRNVLDNFLRSGIIPVLILNLILGFMIPGIDVYGHIGGLIGGIVLSYTLGLPNKRKTKEIVNGLIITLILIAALSYMLIIK